MPSIFSRIIAGELPARFVWKDDRCVAFLSNRPLRPGHTLVVPRLEVDHWLDADPELLGSLSLTAQVIGKAQMAAFDAARIGVLIAGLEVPHLHIHVVPRWNGDSNFMPVVGEVRVLPETLERTWERVRSRLGA